MTPEGKLTTLHSFSGTDGAGPYDGLTQGSDGNFYGTTADGGASNGPSNICPYGCGTVFMITPTGAFTTLHNFVGNPDGANPAIALIQANNGKLYGTTDYGGAS